MRSKPWLRAVGALVLALAVASCDDCDNELIELEAAFTDALYDFNAGLAADIEENGGECTTTPLRNAFGDAIGTKWRCRTCN